MRKVFYEKVESIISRIKLDRWVNLRDEYYLREGYEWVLIERVGPIET